MYGYRLYYSTYEYVYCALEYIFSINYCTISYR